ncbi:hypothetical protein T492DRAFT_895753 [Pavlovales sp. CCMP2436]|nr:hypothetical protein T492DRAFT_895753 [Pavlovales sp. CCMP2436]
MGILGGSKAENRQARLDAQEISRGKNTGPRGGRGARQGWGGGAAAGPSSSSLSKKRFGASPSALGCDGSAATAAPDAAARAVRAAAARQRAAEPTGCEAEISGLRAQLLLLGLRSRRLPARHLQLIYAASPPAARAGCLRASSLPGAMDVTALRRMADQGDAEAQFHLGRDYHRGQNVPQDCAEAAALYRNAADQGHLGAHYSLGLCFRDGTGVPQDDYEAAWLFRRELHIDETSKMQSRSHIAEAIKVPGGADPASSSDFPLTDLMLTEEGARTLVVVANTDYHFKSLCAVAGATSTNLRGLNLGAARAVLLAFELRNTVKFAELSIGWNEIGDVGAQHIAEALEDITTVTELGRG